MTTIVKDVGLELEYFTLRGFALNDNRDLADQFKLAVNARMKDVGLDGNTVPEAWVFLHELNSPVWAVGPSLWNDIQEYLIMYRQILREEAFRFGLNPLWIGYAPFQVDLSLMTSGDRYRELSKLPGVAETLKTFTTASMQVQNGIEGVDARVLANTRMMEHQPLLLALAANSYNPDKGNLADRAFRWIGMPNTGIPQVAFRNKAQYDAYVAQQHAEGLTLADGSTMWLASRPHHKYPTLEGRVMCAQPSVERTVQLAAFHTALVEMEGSKPENARLPDLKQIRENYFFVAGVGFDAPYGYEGEVLSVEQVFDITLQKVLPYAEKLGCADLVEGLKTVFTEDTPAMHQRDIWQQHGENRSAAWKDVVRSLRHTAGDQPDVIAA